MIIYSMGFTKKSAQEFFYKIKKNNIQCVIDIRLNNNSQLAGFTKGKDLEFFLNELCNCKYIHVEAFAPTKDLLNSYKKKIISWNEYVSEFENINKKRNMINLFIENFGQYDNILLLCSEPTPECCHRRLLAESIANKLPNTSIIHI